MRLFKIKDLTFNKEDFLNYIVEIQGFLNQEDEFITKKEIEENPSLVNGQVMDLFVIRLYKCADCGKWIIDILE